ncbi:MAG TPA: MarR family winged helix-turn-helix transcriptional regulator [Acidimicrobiales bacterium]|nr:MarR family winged helix-turn-helix transcriptional regulator [Acidimicrobiales bacterium]
MANGAGGVRWLDDQEAAAWRAFVRVMHRVSAGVARDLSRDHGLSEPEYAVMVHLSESPGHTVRMGELAAGLDWSRSRLSHLLTRMEARGLVTRRDCPSDARGALATLTPTGLAEITAAAPGHVASVRRHFVDLLDHEQLAQVAAAMQAVLDAQGACPTDGCATTDEGCDRP